MIRIALAGCGEHSRSSHAAPLYRYNRNHPGEIELVATCDLNEQRAAEFCRTFGFARSYQNLDQMLEQERPDACVCIMPIERIVDTGIQLLERGVPCVIEKPLGTSLVEAERLNLKATETKTPHMVSVNRRFMPYLNQAKAWMEEVGPLRYVRAVQVRHARAEEDFIWSTAIHVVDALRYMTGEIDRFEVEIQERPDMANWYIIAVHFENGVDGRIEILPTSGMVEESYEFFGDDFRSRVTAGSGTQRSLECWLSDRLVTNCSTTDDEAEDLRNGAYQEVEEFVHALQTGTHPKPGIDEIFPSARICFSIADLVKQKEARGLTKSP